MELAEGGDLFDKIESDVGVGEDVAHLYFQQLVSAVSYMHSKGVGHRDIKPENILLSSDGSLKIADFGLATLFSHNGATKLCRTSCGSPPYTAPEVVDCDARQWKTADQGYRGDLVDIWSCGIVLFVLLVGNTPWDEPLDRSYEFHEYVATDGHPDDELWNKLPADTSSLLRSMLQVEPTRRFSLAAIRRHPWFTRRNPYLSADGKLENPVALATEMFESIKIDFSQEPDSSQRSRMSENDMVADSQGWQTKFALTQPEAPVNDIMFDWEGVSRPKANSAISASQPNVTDDNPIYSSWDDQLAGEPSFSQFSATPSVPLSKTQYARKFYDILPPHSLTRFFSTWPSSAVHEGISGSLHRLGIPTVGSSNPWIRSETHHIRIRTMDTRKCLISGDIVIERMAGIDGHLLEVNFVKAKGDPLEWRRLFKNVVLFCKDAVYRPEQ